MTINWSEKLDKFGRRFLQHFGVDPDWLPTASNAVCDIVKSDPASVVAFMESDPKGSIIAVSRLAVACQMAVYDRVGGPEGDREPKGLRRHWYHWYKVNFALPLSLALGENPNDPKWGLNWAGRLSQTYGWYVDRKGATYTDLWVKDASRMMQIFGTELFPRANIIICVEKDSLFDDFVAASRAIGAKALISGKGKSSKAAIEKLLRRIQEPSMPPSHTIFAPRLVVRDTCGAPVESVPLPT